MPSSSRRLPISRLPARLVAAAMLLACGAGLLAGVTTAAISRLDDPQRPAPTFSVAPVDETPSPSVTTREPTAAAPSTVAARTDRETPTRETPTSETPQATATVTASPTTPTPSTTSTTPSATPTESGDEGDEDEESGTAMTTGAPSPSSGTDEEQLAAAR